MSQCVPSWDLDGNASESGRRILRSPANSAAAAAGNIPLLDYEVAELTWQNGQVALHGLGLPRVPTRAPPETSSSAPAKYAWDNKPRDGGTLESIVNPATIPDEDELVPWFDRHGTAAIDGGASRAVAMDALVPCPNVQRSDIEQRRTRVGNAASTYTPVGSCSGPVRREEEIFAAAKRARTAAARGEWSKMDQISVSGSARDDDSRRMTLGGFTSTTSLGSPENTRTTAGEDRDDSVSHSKLQMGDEEEKKKRAGKSSVSTKRSRAAAIHNQSERKRRDKINQRMKTLQRLVPNSSKTDKASMLDEVIEYLKQLQAQVTMMGRMNMPSMMLPMAMQQQLQMSMMGMGMGMGIMDMNNMNNMNNMNRATPNMMSNPFMAMPNASWDGMGTNDNNPMAQFLACQSQQPMTMDAYSRMASMYQQLQLLQQYQQQQQPTSSRKS